MDWLHWLLLQYAIPDAAGYGSDSSVKPSVSSSPTATAFPAMAQHTDPDKETFRRRILLCRNDLRQRSKNFP